MIQAFRYTLRGEVDLASAPGIRDDLRAIVSVSDSDVLIDCTHLTFIDSTGITVLLEAHRSLNEHGRELIIVNVQAGLRRTFEVLGLTDLLQRDHEHQCST